MPAPETCPYGIKPVSWPGAAVPRRGRSTRAGTRARVRHIAPASVLGCAVTHREPEPATLAILVGMLAAVGVLGQALVARAMATVRAIRAREPG